MTSVEEVQGLACQLIPGTTDAHGPGWYLVSVSPNWEPGAPIVGWVECGPFPSENAALRTAEWMEEEALGVFPAPWVPYRSRRGLIIGTRLRPPRERSRVA